MRAKHAFLFAGLLGCGAAAVAVASELESAPAGSRAAPIRTPVTPATPFPSDRITVELTAVTLGEDCAPPAPTSPAPAPKKQSEAPLDETAPARKAASDAPHGFAAERARRACEQTSMQFSINAPAGLPATQMTVKKVELYDEKGKLVGKLTPRSPTKWTADGSYVAWDEKIAPGQLLQASYELSAPDWTKVKERWNKTFTVKAVITVGGADQKLKRDVYVVGETHLPPGVVT